VRTFRNGGHSPPYKAYRKGLWHVLQRNRMPTSLPHFGQRAALRASFNLVRGRWTMFAETFPA
jgi:hypothetical protein